MRNFYACSVCKPGDDYCEDNFNRILEKKGFVLHETTLQKGTFMDIKSEDILLLKYNKMYVAYGKVRQVEISKDDGWNHWAYVEDWIFYDNNNTQVGIDRYGVDDNTVGGGKYGTVKTLVDSFAYEKIKLINNESILFFSIQKDFKMSNEYKNMQEKIELLEYKKQIILQGPPGTGKTRLAKMMAEEMTNVVRKISPIDVINDFFKNYTTNDNILKKRESIETLINLFVEKFKPEEIANLSLEDYALGREEKDGFCYWLEYLLKGTGKYNGPADKGRIYFNSKDNKYIKSGFLQDIIIDSDAMKLMTIELDKIVNEKFDEGVNFEISRNFVLKILNTYYPETYFPINSEHCINNVLKIFGQDSTGLNYIEKNKKVQSLFIDKRKEFNTDITNYEFMYFLFNTFNLKKEVKLENNEIVIKGDYKIIQFHPSYSYEDFVRGITAKTNEKGNINYSVENRILMGFANEALENPESKYVLIIDEINRANLPSVLGELIYALEYRYNHKQNNLKEAAVESLYDISEDDEESNKILVLPDNLYIIGTMNTADRSVGHIDYAIKRRFAFVDILPSEQAIDDVITDPDLNAKAKFLYHKVADLFNEDKNKTIYLQSDFKAKDVQLGHSYFLAETEKQLKLKLDFEIKPLLNEYIKDGILSEETLLEIAKL